MTIQSQSPSCTSSPDCPGNIGAWDHSSCHTWHPNSHLPVHLGMDAWRCLTFESFVTVRPGARDSSGHVSAIASAEGLSGLQDLQGASTYHATWMPSWETKLQGFSWSWSMWQQETLCCWYAHLLHLISLAICGPMDGRPLSHYKSYCPKDG